MKEILHKLFAMDQTGAITATVNRWLSPGRYELTDDSGRIIQADATTALSPFQRVIVQSGRVVSLSGQISTIKTYEV
ncbi:MAG: hypothetical protein ACOYB1_18655 [Limnohabitans sp.]